MDEDLNPGGETVKRPKLPKVKLRIPGSRISLYSHRILVIDFLLFTRMSAMECMQCNSACLRDVYLSLKSWPI